MAEKKTNSTDKNETYITMQDAEENALNGRSLYLTNEQFDRLLTTRHSGGDGRPGMPQLTHPGPIALIGFVMTLMPSSVCLMQFGHLTPASNVALVGVMYLFGGICLWVSCIMAWLVGDVLSMVTYAAFGSFSLVFGFNTQPTQLVAQTLGGPTSASMNDAIATFVLVYSVFCLIMALSCLRMNLVLLLINIFYFLYCLLAGAGYFSISRHPNLVDALFKAAGACAFICTLPGWYFFAKCMFDAVGLGIHLPMGEFSKSKKEPQLLA